MLTFLSINNIALFSQLDINIPSGFIAITGETGAGKSIILDAVSFIIGKKVNNILKYSEEKGYVIATFENFSSEVYSLLMNANITVQDSTIILKRTITIDNKTKCFINNELVTLSFLKKVGNYLLEIHGQQDQQFLSEESMQMQMLDNYSDNHDLLKETGKLYQKYKDILQEYNEKKFFVEQSIREIDYLQYIIKELEEISPQIGEENQLNIRRINLIAKDKIDVVVKDTMNEIERIVQHSSINQYVKHLIRLCNQHQYLNDVIEPLETAIHELNVANDRLYRILSNQISEDNLEYIEERLFKLRALAKKHNTTADELAQVMGEAKDKLNLLCNSEKEFEDLNEKIVFAKQQYLACAQTLSTRRQKYALQLQNHIITILQELRMNKVKIDILIEENDKLYFTGNGINKIIFLISTNPGVPLAKLNEIASGGELSRVMLAIKTTMAKKVNNITMIFDEIDTGLGGIAVNAVGEKLSNIDNEQVIVVTHQPQIAARAKHQLSITKNFIGDTTSIDVKWLINQQDRENEIARMISGENITIHTLTAAREFLSYKKNLT